MMAQIIIQMAMMITITTTTMVTAQDMDIIRIVETSLVVEIHLAAETSLAVEIRLAAVTSLVVEILPTVALVRGKVDRLMVGSAIQDIQRLQVEIKNVNMDKNEGRKKFFFRNNKKRWRHRVQQILHHMFKI